MDVDIEKALREAGLESDVLIAFRDADYETKKRVLIPNSLAEITELQMALSKKIKETRILALYRALIDVGSLCAKRVSLNHLYQKALARGYI